MIKKYIVCVAISAYLLSLLFGCNAPEAQLNGDSVMKPEITAPTITDVSQPDDKVYYTCDYNGVQRKYILHIPKGMGEGAPLVFMLHGYTSNSNEFMEYTDMNSAADKYGYAVVYPQGLCGTDYNTGSTCWNAGLDFTDTDDAGFLVALAEYLQQTYGFSSSQTFAAGFSNGGFMCYKLACEASGTFRAIASVSGTMSGQTWRMRDDSVSVPVLQVHGTADNVVPIDGSMDSGGGWGGAPALDEILEYWKGADNAGTLEEVKMSDKATAYRYSGKGDDNRVWYIEIKGLGHEWPRMENAGFSADEAILEFFNNYVN